MSTALQRIAALVLLVATLPVLAVIAALVMALQGRPVLFRQVRSGKDGVPFRLVKFRSMRDLRDAVGVLLPDDQRVTPIGAFLRRSRLDELPSLWNVAAGELTFIGPRPLLPQTIADLGDRGIDRGKVAPGLTGWAQVNGNTLLTLDQKIDLDLWYVAHRNIVTDVKILMRTVWVMVAGEKQTLAVGKVR
ncbi:sugar transferase [Novosphingobium lentum]|uniref:sugar transferase n=1 Tax=Novosphingobium lentum TaxID=145287 RepID=UPI00082CA0DF|nr:sugar transferase [Novosphingobium lentum]